MNKHDKTRNSYQLNGKLKNKGYDWWWHSFTGENIKTGEKRSFFIEYFIINPGINDDNIHFNVGEKPTYVMIKAGSWGTNKKQLHNFYPISQLVINENPFSLKVNDNYLSEEMMRGSVVVTDDQQKDQRYMCDAGSMSWNLKINKLVPFNVGYGANKFFRSINAFSMYWHAEGMKTAYTGEVIFESEQYRIDPSIAYGYADKNWGSDFTSPWVWISSTNLFSVLNNKKLDNSVFDIGGGCPVAFNIPIKRKLLIDLYLEGQEYEFNFSKFWTLCRTKFDCYETDNQVIWKIQTENYRYYLELKSTCDKKDMLMVNYVDPKGFKKHNRLYNGGTGVGNIKVYRKSFNSKVLIDDINFINAGCEYGEYEK